MHQRIPGTQDFLTAAFGDPGIGGGLRRENHWVATRVDRCDGGSNACRGPGTGWQNLGLWITCKADGTAGFFGLP
jgi:hypothetical protein